MASGLFQELCHFIYRRNNWLWHTVAVHLKMPNHAWFTSLLSHFVYVCETFFRMLAFSTYHMLCSISMRNQQLVPSLNSPPQLHNPNVPNHSKRCVDHFEDWRIHPQKFQCPLVTLSFNSALSAKSFLSFLCRLKLFRWEMIWQPRCLSAELSQAVMEANFQSILFPNLGNLICERYGEHI